MSQTGSFSQGASGPSASSFDPAGGKTRPGLEWLRTGITCAVLVGGLLLVLPLLPDQDARGFAYRAHQPVNPIAAAPNALVGSSAAADSSVATASTSGVRRVAPDSYHRS